MGSTDEGKHGDDRNNCVDRNFQIVDSGHTAADFLPEFPTRKLGDLVGAATVKRSLTEIIERARSARVNGPGNWLGGYLLYGPPSCGKTFAVEVIAGEIGVNLWAIQLDQSWHRNNIAGILDRALNEHVGNGTIIYLNHLDNRYAAETLKDHLPRLDAAREHRRVGILGAAVLPWLVDSSIARLGRLGRPLLVLPPDAPLRRLFIEQRLRGKVTSNENDIDWIVERTDGHSFGDLEILINDVITQANDGHVDRSAWRIARRDVPPSCAEWLSTAGQHAMMNEAGGVYDDLINYFASRQKY